MVRSVTCPLCQINSLPQIVHSKLRHGHKGKILRCNECEFVFLYPRLTDEEQKHYYQTVYRDEYDDFPVSERFLTDQSEASRRMERLLPALASASSLLEIGSGSGAFLSLANSQLKRVVGIELDKKSQVYMKQKGLEVYEDLKSVENQKFDIIVMFHVLEHILQPAEFLDQIKEKLSSNGKIVIEVPNIDDALCSLYDIEEFKDFYFCIAHVSYFSNNTLAKCLKQAGMSSQISYVQRYDLTNHLNWILNRAPGGLPQKQNIFSPLTQETYSEDLSAKGYSDTLWAIAKT
jgi:2-polyprenyl-3-methyl-5-hydroxy-6-metoxy-1,4-benzoquinol methylase